MQKVQQHSLASPIYKWIDRLKPGHTQDNGMDTDWSDIEGLGLTNAGNGELKSNFPIDIG